MFKIFLLIQMILKVPHRLMSSLNISCCIWCFILIWLTLCALILNNISWLVHFPIIAIIIVEVICNLNLLHWWLLACTLSVWCVTLLTCEEPVSSSTLSQRDIEQMCCGARHSLAVRWLWDRIMRGWVMQEFRSSWCWCTDILFKKICIARYLSTR